MEKESFQQAEKGYKAKIVTLDDSVNKLRRELELATLEIETLKRECNEVQRVHKELQIEHFALRVQFDSKKELQEPQTVHGQLHSDHSCLVSRCKNLAAMVETRDHEVKFLKDEFQATKDRMNKSAQECIMLKEKNGLLQRKVTKLEMVRSFTIVALALIEC